MKTYELTVVPGSPYLYLVLRLDGQVWEVYETSADDFGARIQRGYVREAREKGYVPRYCA